MKEQTLVEQTDLRSADAVLGNSEGQEVYICQGYPQNLWHRLSWVLSLLFSYRGSLWSWRVKTSGPLPEPLLKEIRKVRPQLVDMREFTKNSESHVTGRFAKATREFAKDLVWVIFLAAIARNDPYFWGDIQADWKISQNWVFRSSCLLTRTYRFFLLIHLLKALMTVVHSFRVMSLFVFAIVCSRVFQPEDWMIPHMFGPFSALHEHGLIGFWGLYWHQLLRFDFLTWSRWTLSSLPLRYQKAHAVKICIYLFVPFTLSGIVHACGSYTQFNDTNGPRDTIVLSLVHPVGIGLQHVFSTIVLAKLPKAIRRLAVLITTYAWLCITGIALAEDIICGGFFASLFVTLFTDWRGDRSSQPLPFMGIWRGEGWWQSGIRIL